MAGEVLPSIVAGARAGGRVQGGNPMLPVIEADIASRAADRLASVAGSFIGVAAQYSERQVNIAKQEQQVLATQAHNSISAELRAYSNSFAQSDNPEWDSFDAKFENKSAELYSKAAEKLSSFAQKKLKDSMIINEQGYKNNVQAYRERQLAKNREISSAGTYKQSENNAAIIPPALGKPDLFMDQFIIESGSRAAQKGMVDTPESINRYMKSSGQSIENFNSQTLTESKAVVKKELKGLEAGTNAYIEKKTLLDSIDSAIARKNFIQNGVDRVQTVRFNNYIKDGNLVSANNLIQNASEGGGGYQVSEAVINGMQDVQDKSNDLFNATNVSNAAFATATTNKNPNIVSKADMTTDFNAQRNDLSKSLAGVVKKTKALALKNYDLNVGAYMKAYSATKVKTLENTMKLFDERKLTHGERDAEIDKFEASGNLSADLLSKLRTMNDNKLKERAESATGQAEQNTILQKTQDAFQLGFGYIDMDGRKVKVEVNSEPSAKSFYEMSNGYGNTAFNTMWKNRDRMLEPNRLQGALSELKVDFGNFIKKGGGIQLQGKMDFTKGQPSISEYKKAITEIQASEMVLYRAGNRGFSFGTIREPHITTTFGEVGTDASGLFNSVPGIETSIMRRSDMRQLYNDTYYSNNRQPWMPIDPNPNQLTKFAEQSGYTLDENGNYDFVEGVPSEVIQGYYQATTTSKERKKELE